MAPFTLENRTPLPDAEVRALVAFAAEALDLSETHVLVRLGARRNGWRGFAFHRLPEGDWPAGTNYLVRLSLNRHDLSSGRWRGHLVEAVAHEALHVAQFKEGRRHSQGRAVAHALESESRARQRERLSAYRSSPRTQPSSIS